MVRHTRSTYRGTKRPIRTRFHSTGQSIRLNDNTVHSVSSIGLAHCTYCLITRGNSPHGRRITLLRDCFTIRAHATRLLRRHVNRVLHVTKERTLATRRGRLDSLTCGHKIKRGSFNIVHSHNSRTLFNVDAARVGFGLSIPGDHPLTSILRPVTIATGRLTARVAGCKVRRHSLRKAPTVAQRRISGGGTIQGDLFDHNVTPRSLPTVRSVGGIRHETGHSRGHVRKANFEGRSTRTNR